MNPQSHKNTLTKLILSLTPQKNGGYTLVEIIIVLFIFAIMTAIVAPLIRLNDPIAESETQLKGILQQAKGRAISTTSALIIRPNPDPNINNEFIVERTSSGKCNTITQVSQNVTPVPGLKDLPVNSTAGFKIGEEISVGANQYTIIGKRDRQLIIVVGRDVNSHSEGESVTLVDNWELEGSFTQKDLTLPQEVKVTASNDGSNVPDWTICFDSRGVAFIFDGPPDTGSPLDNLTLEISYDVINNPDTQIVTVFQGGAIE